MSSSRTPERLYRVHLILKHLRLISIIHNRHRLPRVNLVLSYRVSVQVSDALDGVGRTFDCAFVGFHNFFDGSADVAEADVDSGVRDSGFGGVLNGFEEL